jgi:hypothetical protein
LAVRRIYPHEFASLHFEAGFLTLTAIDSMHGLAVFMPDVEVVSAHAVVSPPSAFRVEVFDPRRGAFGVPRRKHGTTNKPLMASAGSAAS